MFLRSSSAWIGHHAMYLMWPVTEVDQVRRQYKQLTSFWKLHRRDSSATIPDLSGSWTLIISCNSPNLLPPSRHSHVAKAFSPANLEKIEQTLRSVSADHWSLSHLVSSK